MNLFCFLCWLDVLKIPESGGGASPGVYALLLFLIQAARLQVKITI